MNRRGLLLALGGAVVGRAGAAGATILFDDRAVKLDRVRTDANELWVRGRELARINGFELKPQGACRDDICIPVNKSLTRGPWFNLTGFARKVGQTVVAESGVWSFGEIPELRGSFRQSRLAPDWTVPDRRGRLVHLSDFRGKKVLLLTWASW